MKRNWPPKVSRSSRTLHKTVKAGRSVFVKVLLWAGTDVNATNCCMQTPLHVACESSTKRVVKLLLESGADVNAQNEKGDTPLHVVCRSSHRNSKMNIELLLSFGAKINAKNKSGETSLHMASCLGNQNSVVVLLRRGAAVNVVDKNGLTPLHAVACSNNFSISLMNALLEANAPVNAMDSKGMSPLHYLVWNSKPEESISAILNKGGDTNLQDSKGQTPLHIACKLKMKGVACLLLGKGARVGMRDISERTALHSATQSFSPDIVDALVDKGAAVNSKDDFGNTPLHLAFSCKYKVPRIDSLSRLDIVKKLLEKGAKVDAKNKYLRTPYDESIRFIHILHLEGNYACSHEFNKRQRIKEVLTEHIVKLKTAKLQVEIDTKETLESRLYKIVQTRCCLELEHIRSTKVCEDMTLCNVLSKGNKPYLLTDDGCRRVKDNEQFLHSTNLIHQFPMYGHLLRTTFQRSKLLTLAVKSFYNKGRKQMVKNLPYLVAELVMTFLSNEDLRNFINSE